MHQSQNVYTDFKLLYLANSTQKYVAVLGGDTADYFVIVESTTGWRPLSMKTRTFVP